MSNYQDDLVDVITLSDGTHAALKMMVGDKLTSRDEFNNKNKENLDENLTITDELSDKFGLVANEGIGIIDHIQDKKISRELLTERISISDTAYRISRDTSTDSVFVSDTIRQALHAKDSVNEHLTAKDGNRHTLKDQLKESMGVSGTVGNNRTILDKLADTLGIQECLQFAIKHLANDTVGMVDKLGGKQQAKNSLSVRLSVGDGVIEQFGKTPIDDGIKVGDEIWDRLTAKDTLADRAMVVVLDELIYDDDGMAWTMNTVNHAMSQYLPYNVNRLAVVNGVLYGECDDGVYRLDGKDETITGVLATDKIDYGEQLVKPSYAYSEYKTDGSMSLAVHTTQKGIRQSYTYRLPKEMAREMTNGRFVFGRGLFGRQFAYTLQITAKQALLHDLNIHFETTKRRL